MKGLTRTATPRRLQCRLNVWTMVNHNMQLLILMLTSSSYGLPAHGKAQHLEQYFRRVAGLLVGTDLMDVNMQ